ncbi:MAG: YceI family protein [Pacificibacter sp.]|uniref:YceI family protein n=1 Tax=Pacificibacter sp. TaxID=1917866 RepID=UPI00321ACDA0
MKNLLLSTVIGLGFATAAVADVTEYKLDASHSQIVFSWNHLGYSSTTGVYSGFDGTIMFDDADAANSSVEVAFPADSLFTGWAERTAHILSPDFFNAEANPTVSFKSTGIEVTGENTGIITGDLTLNGVTKSVALDATMNQMGEHPMAKMPWAGFDATTTVLRSDFNVGNFAPFVGDEVTIEISIEAMKAM